MKELGSVGIYLFQDTLRIQDTLRNWITDFYFFFRKTSVLQYYFFNSINFT